MRVFLDTVGCRLNQAEIEAMARQFRAAGHQIVSSAGLADLAVVNTCSVTAQAASDSRGKLRSVARQGGAAIVATGCWATLRPREAALMQGVSRVVSNAHKDGLITEILGRSGDTLQQADATREPLPGARRRTRAFIKVQDGCNNQCTFCVTTIARGPSRSRSAADVISDVQAALNGGTKEIVLTGVQLGSWGQDLNLHLKDLLRLILRETDALRVRLSSLEPWDLDADFFALWSDRRLCNHFHLPLQSGCRSTLKRMARKTTPGSYRALVTAARQAVPDAAITTDVIAGFPGETEAEFQESLEFVSEMEFAGGHAFTYSPMPGTAARRMRNPLPLDQRRLRNRRYREVLGQAAHAFQLQQLGKIRPVLWESTSENPDGSRQLSGLTDNYLRVRATAPELRWNQIDEVLLREAISGQVLGFIAKTG
jgi:threonylcarbamoyladenosine tRNA methylthiotransferase MtaB